MHVHRKCHVTSNLYDFCFPFLFIYFWVCSCLILPRAPRWLGAPRKTIVAWNPGKDLLFEFQNFPWTSWFHIWSEILCINWYNLCIKKMLGWLFMITSAFPANKVCSIKKIKSKKIKIKMNILHLNVEHNKRSY